MYSWLVGRVVRRSFRHLGDGDPGPVLAAFARGKLREGHIYFDTQRVAELDRMLAGHGS